MHKKIINLCFCILSLWTAEAQQQGIANRLLNNVIKLSNTLVNDASIKDPCKKNIKTFSSNLPAPNKVPADTKSINTLIQVGTTFINSSQEANAKQCSNEKINSLIDSTTQLVKVLQQLNKPAADSAVVKATFTRQTKNGEAGWQLNIDSLSSSIGSSLNGIAVKDSLGYMQVILSRSSRNAVKINANDSSIKVMQGQHRLVIVVAPKNESETSSGAMQRQLNTLHTANKSLLIAILLLVFLILAGVWLYTRTNRKYKLLLASVSDYPREPETDISTAQTQTNDQQPPGSVMPAINEESDPMIKEVDEMPVIVPTRDGNEYISCEVMMTAGPRKKPMSDPHSDIDLGEDVCGFISDSNGVFVWLLDGTSDDYPLKNPLSNREYFSARLLAQSIGDGLRNKFTGSQHDSFANMLQQTIEEVKVNWLQTINALPDEEKEMLRRNITNKNFPHCSTTALIARLQKNGSLDAYRVGDSKMLLFSVSPDNDWNVVDTSLAEKNENGADRIFFRLELKEDDNFDIVSNGNLEYDIEAANNVHTMICFSDGIGLETEQSLKQDYKADPVKTKRQIMYEVQGTGDDKSICFIELKKNG